MKRGDRNSRFCHKCANGRKAKNRIRGLTNLQGTWSQNIQEIENSVLGYFNIFRSNQGSDLDAGEIFDALDQRIDVDMLHVLEAEFTDTKFKDAFFQMEALKTPSPNGIPLVFFQKFWHIVGRYVSVVILSVLNYG